MLQITSDFKEKTATALLQQRENFDGTDAAFARQYGLNKAVFSRLKNGERERIISDSAWLEIGRKLGISISGRQWNIVKTEVFEVIEEDILFCKENSKSMLFIDECGIGKTVAAKYLSNSLKNCFYLDASQCKTKNEFIRVLARVIGVSEQGRVIDIKENTKYYLRMLPKPIVIIDEPGDLHYEAFMTIKEYWNATEGCVGWYLIGADGLRAKMEKGIRNRKVGYAEMFSRFSENYSRVVPLERAEKQAFYRKLINDVLIANTHDKDIDINAIAKKCLVTDDSGRISGLRRAESLMILNS